MTPCLLVKMYRLFGGPCSLCLPDVMKKLFSAHTKSKHGGGNPPCNVCSSSPNDTALYYGRLEYLLTSLWHHQYRKEMFDREGDKRSIADF